MKELNDNLKYFEKYLLRLTNQIVLDLQDILSDKIVVYKNNKTILDIKGYFFEYEYKYLDIIFYGLDKNLNLVTETIKLPTKLINENFKNHLMPECIYNSEIDIDNGYDEQKYSEEEFYDIFDEYKSKMHDIFLNWFFDCWKKAVGNKKLTVYAYFSVHDSYYSTDLKTMKRVNDDEIKKRFHTKN